MISIMKFLSFMGSALAWWLMLRTPDPEVGGSSPTRVKPCCVLEQGTFTPQKVLVIPRKRWLHPNMTEKLFTGTLRINQPTNLSFMFTLAIYTILYDYTQVNLKILLIQSNHTSTVSFSCEFRCKLISMSGISSAN